MLSADLYPLNLSHDTNFTVINVIINLFYIIKNRKIIKILIVKKDAKSEEIKNVSLNLS